MRRQRNGRQKRHASQSWHSGDRSFLPHASRPARRLFARWHCAGASISSRAAAIVAGGDAGVGGVSRHLHYTGRREFRCAHPDTLSSLHLRPLAGFLSEVEARRAGSKPRSRIAAGARERSGPRGERPILLVALLRFEGSRGRDRDARRRARAPGGGSRKHARRHCHRCQLGNANGIAAHRQTGNGAADHHLGSRR